MTGLTKPFSQPNLSVLAVIECLQWLAIQSRPISNIEMARTMGVHRNRANRLLKSLVMAGIASQGPDRKFSIGSGFHVLGAQSLYASGILRKTLPILESLHPLKSIVALGVLWKDQITYLYFHEPGLSVAQGVGAHSAVPATASSIGLALLAHHPEAVIDTFYRDRPIPDFANLDELKIELARTRERGFGRHAHRGIAEHLSEAIGIRFRGTLTYAVALGEWPANQKESVRRQALQQAARDIEAALADPALP